MAGGDLTALRDRLRAASGSDRELDARIEAWEAGRTFLEWHAPYYTSEEVAGSNGGDSSPVTSSIDAAIALCERKLPGWGHAIISDQRGNVAYVHNNESHFIGIGGSTKNPNLLWFETRGATAPLAILLSLLEAMIGKETGDG